MENYPQENHNNESTPETIFSRRWYEHYEELQRIEALANDPNADPEKRAGAQKWLNENSEALEKLLDDYDRLDKEERAKIANRKMGETAMNDTRQEGTMSAKAGEEYLNSEGFLQPSPAEAKSGEPDRWVNPKAA